MIGCCELMEYVLYVSLSVFQLGKMCSTMFVTESKWEPLYWFFFFVSAILIQLIGGKTFWTVNKILAITASLVLVLFCLCTIPIMDFNQHAKLTNGSDPWFKLPVGQSIMEILPFASWWYVGIEALPLAGQETQNVSV